MVDETHDEPDLEAQAEQAEPETAPEEKMITQSEVGRIVSAERQRLQAQIAEQKTRNDMLEEQANKQNDHIQRMEGRFSQLMAMQAPQDDDRDPMDKLYDEVGNLKSALSTQNEEFKAYREQSAHEKAAQEALQRAASAYQSATMAFKAEHPDYDAAIAHFVQNRRQEIENIAGVTDAAAIDAHIQEEQARITQNAIATGRNPAEVLYQTAQLRGYKPLGNGGQTGATSRPDPNEVIAAQAAGQRHQDIDTGGAKSSKWTLGAIADLPDDEFDAIDWNEVKRLTP